MILVLIISIIFLIIIYVNSTQLKKEITSLPVITLQAIDSEISNSDNIYNLSDDSIFKQFGV